MNYCETLNECLNGHIETDFLVIRIHYDNTQNSASTKIMQVNTFQEKCVQYLCHQNVLESSMTNINHDISTSVFMCPLYISFA